MFNSGVRTDEQTERLSSRSLIGMIPALPRPLLSRYDELARNYLSGVYSAPNALAPRN